MIVTPIRTHKIRPKREPLEKVLNRYVVSFPERSILAVTSKIVAICEGRTVRVGAADKRKLIEREADYILSERRKNKYNIVLTIKRNVLIPTAGIDESNGNGSYVLWPGDPQRAANDIRQYLRRRFSLRQVGVIITDSTTSPLRLGTTGIAIAWSGFAALKDYVGTPDLFGRKLKVTKANVSGALAAAAVATMGEGNEQTPLALIEDVPFVKFRLRDPSPGELRELHIALRDDLYAPLLTSVKWKRRGSSAVAPRL